MPTEHVKAGPDHFRFSDQIGPEGVTVSMETWVAYAETDKCYYLVPASEFVELVYGHQYPWSASRLKRRRKRVLKHQFYSSRCFAYPDKERAMNSYKIRKEWQRRHATIALERANAALGYFGDSSVTVAEPPERVEIPCDYIQNLGWSEY